ncbi:MAG: SGNH/GDSL hydrolase family protein [Verrucomicrobia bacterium]|nr:SGNH/GDSL hydrolase family protein [Verrucomicrobiota bacterium]
MSVNSEGSGLPAAGSRRRRWLQNLALFCGTFLVCGLMLEVVLRVMGYGNLEVYAPDRKLYWRLKPNQNCFTKVGRRPVLINSHGTRGPEFPLEKPAGAFRILSLGDSRTFGWGLSDEETYSRRLEDLLQQRVGANRKVEVINAGVNAWSYPQMLVYFREEGLRLAPDAVIVGEANLWTQFSEQNSAEFVDKFLGRVRLKNFLRRFALYHFFIEVQLQDFYQRHRTRFIPVDPQQDQFFKEQQQEDPDRVFREAIQVLCQMARSNGVEPLVLFLPTVTDLDSTNESRVLRVKREVAERLGVPLLDLTPDLAGAGKELYLEADPVHLNARGNRIVAERLWESMTKHLSP